MTLNSSGPLSIGGNTLGSSINLEIERPATQVTSLQDEIVRKLAGSAFMTSQSQISLGNLYNKTLYYPFLLFSNSNNSKDDNFNIKLKDNVSNVLYDLNGLADFTYVNEQTTYIWLAPGLSLSTLQQASFFNIALQNVQITNPVYRGIFELPARPSVLRYLGQPSIQVQMINAQNNANGNFGWFIHGNYWPYNNNTISHAVAWSGSSGLSFTYNINWSTGAVY